jgi:hypothetical protein
MTERESSGRTSGLDARLERLERDLGRLTKGLADVRARAPPRGVGEPGRRSVGARRVHLRDRRGCRYRPDPQTRILVAVIAGGLALDGVSLGILEIAERVSSASVETDFERAHTAVSGLWALVGLGLLVLGRLRGSALLRFGGLAVFGLSLAKIFFYDPASLSPVARAFSFFLVGGLLLARRPLRPAAQRSHRPGSPAPRRADGGLAATQRPARRRTREGALRADDRASATRAPSVPPRRSAGRASSGVAWSARAGRAPRGSSGSPRSRRRASARRATCGRRRRRSAASGRIASAHRDGAGEHLAASARARVCRRAAAHARSSSGSRRSRRSPSVDTLCTPEDGGR